MSVKPVVLAAVFVALLAPSSFAASTGGGATEREASSSPEQGGAEEDVQAIYARGLDMAESGRYADALKRFEMAHKKDKKNPEILNMLAFCQRKTGDLDGAFENYAKALEIRPDFPQCREYLAEAHLQAALREVETLRGYGDKGGKELEAALAAFHRAVEQAATGEQAAAAAW